jgi:hypothetical protein
VGSEEALACCFAALCESSGTSQDETLGLLEDERLGAAAQEILAGKLFTHTLQPHPRVVIVDQKGCTGGEPVYLGWSQQHMHRHLVPMHILCQSPGDIQVSTCKFSRMRIPDSQSCGLARLMCLKHHGCSPADSIPCYVKNLNTLMMT